ncbi:MAG: CapA family protein [Clostridia bacterium]|nr:CapA family protein [Clostridia bacterium]
MRQKWAALPLLLALCMTCISLSPAEADGDVSLADYFAGQNGDGGTGQVAGSSDNPEEAPADKAKPIYELDGSVVLTLSFTGDVTIGSNVQSSGKSIFEREFTKQKGDITFPFRNVKQILEADDLTVVNFEGTLTTAGKNPGRLNNEFLFRAPPEYVTMLSWGGVDAVTLENNHAMDMGEEGNRETKQVLLSAGIPYACEGEPAILTVRGVKVGLLAYQTFGGRHDELIGKVPADIAALRAEGCQVVVVNYHWGAELDYQPNDNQVRLGRATVDGGADLVVGHHSHRINPIEYYKEKYICYSLGNFSFAGNNKPRDMATYIFQVKLRVKDGAVTDNGFIIIPCRISSRTDYNDFAPTPYTKDQNVESVVSVLKENSRRLEYAVPEYPLKWPGQE